MVAGPLDGLRVVELTGLVAAPFAAMVLADLGAQVLRIDRRDQAFGGDPAVPPADMPAPAAPPPDVLGRGRRSVAVDLKHPDGAATVLSLLERADVLIEGFRPGVTERLGLGPDECLARNPRLVYARLTGWGQHGPCAPYAGHDINYIALAGALASIGRVGQPPTAPLNLLGDFGGGGLLAAFGVLAALYERERSGVGQVVDAAMVDGAALLTTFCYGSREAGGWAERGTNLLDTGAPFYDCYQTADGGYVSVGALEPAFYGELLRLTGLADEDLPSQFDRAGWPVLRARFAAVFATRTRDEWCALLARTDACFAPVLSLDEAADHPHHRTRGSFVRVDGVVQPAPAPRFSRTPAAVPTPPPRPGQDTDAVLADWGIPAAEIARLRTDGAIA